MKIETFYRISAVEPKPPKSFDELGAWHPSIESLMTEELTLLGNKNRYKVRPHIWVCAMTNEPPLPGSRRKDNAKVTKLSNSKVVMDTIIATHKTLQLGEPFFD